MDRGRQMLLYAVVLVSGAAVLALELAAGRLFAPWFGMSLPVWTNVLAVVLGALAAGYALGGRLAARGATLRTPGWVLLAAGLLSIASAWAGPALAASLLPKGIDLEGLSSILVKGSFVATLVVFGPPMVLLGAVGPLAVHLLAQGVAPGDAGRAAGRVLAISTLGSILGTYLTTYWLIQDFGTRTTVAASGAVLVACGLALVAAGATRGGGAAGAAAVAALGFAALGPGGEFRPAEPGTGKVMAEYDTSYQFLQVREVPEGPDGKVARLLTMNEGVSTYHSVFRPGSVLTGGRYYDFYPALPLLAGAKPGKPFRVLILGYAAGTQARAMRSFWGKAAALEIDGAEIDPEVLRAGREHFESPEGEPGVRVRAVDARAFLAAAAGEGRLYDLVLLDCYHREFYLPFHLASVEFFREVRERLAPGGVLAFNAFAYRPDDPLLSSLLGTVAEAFGSAWICPVPYYPNYVVLASPRPGDLPLLSFSETALAAAGGDPPRDPAWAALAAHPEAREVLRMASRCAAAATPRRREPGAVVLTDDRAPVERLADRALREYDDARRGAR